MIAVVKYVRTVGYDIDTSYSLTENCCCTQYCCTYKCGLVYLYVYEVYDTTYLYIIT